jgi:homoserine kinase type II
VSLALRDEFGIATSRLDRIHAGTATDNFTAMTPEGARWFVKVYRSPAEVPAARAAIELTEFAGQGGVPVPEVRRTPRDDVIAHSHGLFVSVWEFIDEARTAEGGLRGYRWHSVGTAVGHLHRHLATHPSGRPTSRKASDLLDLDATYARCDRLLEQYGQRSVADDSFEAWAVGALIEKRALLPRVQRMLERLPPLTVQTLHGDLAAPNLLMRGEEVAALIDFQPPTANFLAWEVSRIACDPRTVVTNPQWRDELPEFLDAYRQANPAANPVDLASVLAVGSAYTIASTYPLAEPVHRSGAVDDSLKMYGRQRHMAALAMLELA